MEVSQGSAVRDGSYIDIKTLPPCFVIVLWCHHQHSLLPVDVTVNTFPAATQHISLVSTTLTRTT